MSKKLYETDHPYYCEEGNYFSQDCSGEYDTWQDFLDEWGDVDEDMNQIFRWDWNEYDPDEFEGSDTVLGAVLIIHRVLQRKAILRSDRVIVSKADEPAVRKYLEPYAQNMKAIWEPLL